MDAAELTPDRFGRTHPVPTHAHQKNALVAVGTATSALVQLPIYAGG